MKRNGKPRGAAKPNLKRRIPALRRDSGPPPQFPEDEVEPGLRAELDAGDAMNTRHLRRLLQGILLETRTTRQYVMWLHEMLANHEMGKEAEIPTRDGLESKMTKARLQKHREEEEKRFLAMRRSRGLGEDLTPEEQARIAAGEDIDQVLGE